MDPRHSGDESLRNLERKHGVLPTTLEATTGAGGRHVYFAHPGSSVRNRVDIAPGIDLRGDGGCIVASLTGHLLWHGVDPEVALELMLCWNRIRCRPPLDEEEVLPTVLSITHLHDRKL